MKTAAKDALKSSKKTLGTLSVALIVDCLTVSKELHEQVGISFPVFCAGIVIIGAGYFFYNFYRHYNSFPARTFGSHEQLSNQALIEFRKFLDLIMGSEDGKWSVADVTSLSRALTTLSTFYSKVTGTQCCVSLQVVAEKNIEPLNIRIENLARDNENYFKRNSPGYLGAPHYIYQNDAYSKPLLPLLYENSSADTIYINNDINASPGYLTSSREWYVDGKLPYNSEMTIAMTMPLSKESVLFGGFLCVDSPKKNIFDRNRDGHMLRIAAAHLTKAFDKKYPAHLSTLGYVNGNTA